MASLIFPLFVFVQILLLLLFLHGNNAATYWQDVQVLKQLKNGVNPNSVTPGSCLSSWDFAVDPCDRLNSDKFTCGFRCDVVVSSAARVTEVILDRWGYSGSLSSVSDWNLPYLETLDLSGNYFEGPIPDSFVNLTRLRRLSLSRNSLSGWIPSQLGSLANLEELYLDNNNFEGTLPLSLNGLNNLKTLELQDNKLSGELPELGELNSLNYLDASNNAFSGELNSLPASLIELTARNNSIQGNIPATISDLLYLQVLDLSHNNLSGEVPATVFIHPSLQQLSLANNHYGSISEPDPNSFQFSQLIALDLTNNEIRGFLPGFLGLLPRLSSLSLENNKLSGMIPTQYALKVLIPGDETTSQFERLLLGGNYLFGAIPGPFLDLKPGSVTIRLGDNCLYRCPLRLFLCQGGKQKSLSECKAFGPIIP